MIEHLEPSDFFSKREDEKKLGEELIWLNHNWLESLQSPNIKCIIIGIIEDFGPRANLGNPGASNFFEACLAKYASMQSNDYLQANGVAVLGKINFTENFKEIPHKPYNLEDLRELVGKMDEQLGRLLAPIYKAGKIPIFIGGGHNNAYPLIKNAAIQSHEALQVFNLDAHADYRITKEGRHSGNSFSMAAEQGFLNHYAVLGLHKNYNSQEMLARMEAQKVQALFLEDLQEEENPVAFAKSWIQVKKHSKYAIGIDLDIDSIESLNSSARSPYGFKLTEARKILTYLAGLSRISYFNLTEGINDKDAQTAKAAAYLLGDFINAKLNGPN